MFHNCYEDKTFVHSICNYDCQYIIADAGKQTVFISYGRNNWHISLYIIKQTWNRHEIGLLKMCICICTKIQRDWFCFICLLSCNLQKNHMWNWNALFACSDTCWPLLNDAFLLNRLAMVGLVHQQKSELITAIRCAADLGHAINSLPEGWLWAGKLQRWQVGALGSISSLLGLYQALSTLKSS